LPKKFCALPPRKLGPLGGLKKSESETERKKERRKKEKKD
jgi:hypothetical protein